MVEAFREKPGNASHAARKAGVDQRTAQRGWRLGFPHLIHAAPSPESHRPIKDIFAREQEAIRAYARAKEVDDAKLAAVEREKQAAAKEDQLSQKERELYLVRSAQNNAMGLLAVVGELARATIPLSQKLALAITEDARPVEQGGSKLDIEKTLQTVTRLTYVAQSAIGAARTTMEMERRLVGAGDEPATAIKAGHARVDEARVSRALGGDPARMKAAINDLLAGNITADAAEILSSVERDTTVPTH